MQASRQLLKENIKQEVLAELDAQYDTYGQPWHRGPEYGSSGMGRLGGVFSPSLSRADMNRIKREVLIDLQDEIPSNRYSAQERHRGYETAYTPMSSYDQVIANSVKNELLAEMEAQRTAMHANLHGYGQIVSDRNLNNMIEQRYRTLQEVRNDLKREIEAINSMQNQTTTSDPYVRELAYSIVREARGQGVSMDEVIKRLEGQNATTGNMMSNWRQRMSGMINTGQRRGFLYGIGAAVLAAIIYPSIRRNMHEVAVRTVEGGMGLTDRARTAMSRAKEGMEDIIAEAQFNNFQEESENFEEKYPPDEYEQ